MQSFSQEVLMGLETGMRIEDTELIVGLDGTERPEGSPLVRELWGARARCLDCLLEEEQA